MKSLYVEQLLLTRGNVCSCISTSEFNTTTSCHLKRRWSGRESKACPPTYGSPRSQLLLWDSAQWVSLRLCYLLPLSLPAAHRPSRDALFSRSLAVYHFPISSPITWMWILRLSSFRLTEWGVSRATAGSAGNHWCWSWAFVLDHLSEHITL